MRSIAARESGRWARRPTAFTVSPCRRATGRVTSWPSWPPASIRPIPQRWDRRVRLSCACLLLRREALEATGAFDEQYSLSTLQDADLSFRLLASGWSLRYARDVFVHYGGRPQEARRVRSFAVNATVSWPPGVSTRPIRASSDQRSWRSSTRILPRRPCGYSSSGAVRSHPARDQEPLPERRALRHRTQRRGGGDRTTVRRHPPGERRAALGLPRAVLRLCDHCGHFGASRRPLARGRQHPAPSQRDRQRHCEYPQYHARVRLCATC